MTVDMKQRHWIAQKIEKKFHFTQRKQRNQRKRRAVLWSLWFLCVKQLVA